MASSYPASLSTSWSITSPASLAGFLATPGVAGTPLSSPSLVINAGGLPPRQTLTFRITAADAGGSATADIVVPVSGAPYGAGGPGSVGGLSVTPSSGFGLNTTFRMVATGWVSSAHNKARASVRHIGYAGARTA